MKFIFINPLFIISLILYTNDVWLSARPLVASTPKRPVFGRIKKRLQFGSGKTAESPIRKIIILDTSTSTHNNTVQTWEQYLEERVSNLERELETLKKELAPRRILRTL